ncbi:hypothetical protein BCE_3414 [Bacillus cereus ATCC 10987]|uniref:Uncharacterized protein n=1 Tax=Bacillus cereus (strain ATCC 10987 / NRS 248) TaxID=222523 RepID=Q734J1_BACC1|nr:hypothetical protein BCE_3414 [Bacillus cereus ATCC 10987]
MNIPYEILANQLRKQLVFLACNVVDVSIRNV